MSFDLQSIRAEFPVLHQEVNGHPLIYLDNAATSQKPQAVISSLLNFYCHDNSNIHRGAHTLAARSTEAYEATRESARKFLGAAYPEEVIFTKGTTEAINLVAFSYGGMVLQPGDEVLVSAMEHHANIVPWQMICQKTGATLKVIPISDSGEWLMDQAMMLITPRTKIVAIMHVSNALGTVNPIIPIIEKAHSLGAVVLVDGAQAAAHFELDVAGWGCDFYVFSGHKIYGPTGVGVLYGRKELLEAMPPFLGGGEMIAEVSFERTTYNVLPFKFEAGTPNIADVIALNAAFDFISQIGKRQIAEHETALLAYATEKLQSVPGLTIWGTAKEKIAVISFTIEGVHHYDIGMLLDAKGIAVRTGHHCAQPLMRRFGLEGTARASFALYNTFEEVDKLAESVARIAIRRRT